MQLNQHPDLSNKIDTLLEALSKSGESDPHIFNKADVAYLLRLVSLRKRLDSLGAASDDALVDAVTFTLRLKTLGWFGRIILWTMAAAAAVFSQWDKLVEFLQ